VVYDIGVERIDAVRHLLKKYLSWIQNSAFEGELSEASLLELQHDVSLLMDTNRDSLHIYTANNPRWIEKRTVGVEKGSTGSIL